MHQCRKPADSAVLLLREGRPPSPLGLPAWCLTQVCPARTCATGPPRRAPQALKVTPDYGPKAMRESKGGPGTSLVFTCSFALFLPDGSSRSPGSSPGLLSSRLWLWFRSADDGRRPYCLNEITCKTYLHWETCSDLTLTFSFQQE